MRGPVAEIGQDTQKGHCRRAVRSGLTSLPCTWRTTTRKRRWRLMGRRSYRRFADTRQLTRTGQFRRTPHIFRATGL